MPIRACTVRVLIAAFVCAAGSIAPLGTTALAQPAVEAAPLAAPAVNGVGADLWQAAKSGDHAAFEALLRTLAADPTQALSAPAKQLLEHMSAREANRGSRIDEVRTELAKSLAEPASDLSTAKALRSAIELHTLTPEAAKPGVLTQADIVSLVARADSAARAAESRGSIIAAGELFVLLDLLNDTAGTYKPDVRRVSARQEMLRLYAPQRLWELRNERSKAEGNKPLPPYNSFGDDWKAKLVDIDQTLVERALAYSRRHISQRPMNDLLLGGLENVRVMLTMADLREVFPGLGDAPAREQMIAFVDAESEAIRQAAAPYDAIRVGQLVDRLRATSDQTVKLPRAAVLHEFGQGAMSRLDEFSEIIWPDEVRRFNKNTQGRFVGVGIQIEYDELQNIRVVSPIEGTPAQRAGIHPGDLIVKVDGQPIFGLSLDQAVDVITGPENTNVKLTIERAADDAAAPGGKVKSLIDFPLKRTIINVASIRGWKKTGVKEDSWDWFIDHDNSVAYIRMSQFSDTTATELDRAIKAIRKDGAKALVFDLRFNPGGLLDQAVKVAQRFLNVENGYVVMSQGPSGRIEQPEFTSPERAVLAAMPVVVLVNEGSASASEIVSGAIATYANKGQADAVVLGARSYGKGSVQNVWPVTASAMMKLTTAYYMLPDKSIIHRRPGMLAWGVEPNFKVEMLPKQTSEAILFRRNADVVPLDEKGAAAPLAVTPNPDDLITKGMDLQLETALLLLRGRVAADAAVAQKDK